jgi:hypothetical protein
MMDRNIGHKIPKFHGAVSVFREESRVNITRRIAADGPERGCDAVRYVDADAAAFADLVFVSRR